MKISSNTLLLRGAECVPGGEHQAAYALLEAVLAEELGISPLPEIERSAGGKPFFPQRPALCFNLSHSRGAVVCAIHSSPVGVDIERIRPAPRRLSDGLSDEEFFHLWTGREATVKREGRGIGALLKPFPPDGRCLWFPQLLPGWMIAVCPSVPCTVSALAKKH